MRISPTAKNRENVFAALAWTHAHGQTTREILLDVCRVSKADFLQRLAADGYMRKEKVLGRTFWLLNKSGVDLLKSMLPEGSTLAKLPGTRHVNLYAFAHDLHAQRVIAKSCGPVAMGASGGQSGSSGYSSTDRTRRQSA